MGPNGGARGSSPASSLATGLRRVEEIINPEIEWCDLCAL